MVNGSIKFVRFYSVEAPKVGAFANEKIEVFFASFHKIF